MRGLATFLILWAVPLHVHAHPSIDEGVQRFEAADFAGALRSFAEAEARDDLSREELVVLLETRTLIYVAQRRADDLTRELRCLAVLDPEHAFPPTAPPEVSEAFAAEAARVEPPQLELDADIRGNAVHVAVRATAATELVRSLRLFHRLDGGAPIRTEPPAEIAIGDAARIDGWAEAVGPGGVVIARAGSEEAPVELFAAPQPEPAQRGPDIAPSAARPAASRDVSAGAVVWPWIVGASLAIAAGVIVTILLLTADGDTQVIGPAPAGLRLGSW